MIAIAWRSIVNRWFSVGLATLSIALGVGLYLGIERTRDSARASFEASINGVDLIVGARGGDVQILLYSVFNVGNASNNIRYDSLKTLQNMEQIEWIAPISLGDSHRGYRVVGTTQSFFDHVQTGGGNPLDFQAGGPIEGIFGAVIGSTVARELGYGLDQSMIVSHGLVSAGTAEHDDMPFYVAGILKPTGTPIDRNVYVSLKGIEAIHIDWRNGTRIPGRRTSADSLDGLDGLDLSTKVTTAALVGVKSKRRIFQTQRAINDFADEPLSAILPGVALSNLWAVMGAIEISFRFIALAAFVVSLLGLMALLNMSLAQRRREMAIYRALGARPWQIAALLLIEAVLIGVIAIVLGALITIGIEGAVSAFAFEYTSVSLQYRHFGLSEGQALGTLLGATVVAGLIPAIRLYRQSLNLSLTVTE